jgi:signal peptidase
MSVRRLARTRFVAGVAALTAITAIFWWVLWAAVVPLVRGWSPVAVVSGSMAPLIDSGDIVVAAPYDGEALDAGAVIVFDNPTGTGSMTHRVVDVTPGGDYVTRPAARPAALR